MSSGTERKQQILFVDDEEHILSGFGRSLREHLGRWDFHFAQSGKQALEMADELVLDLIVTDARMPGMSGLELLKVLRGRPDTCDVPTIMLTGHCGAELRKAALDCGVIDFLNKPIEPQEFVVRVGNVLRLKSIGDELRIKNKMLEECISELTETRLQIIRRLGKAAEYRDNETGHHVLRVAYYSRLLAVGLGLAPEFVELLYHTAPMHDIGKIGIPDGILNKPGSLDLYEWEIMRKHCPLGEDTLKPLTAEEVALYRQHSGIGESILGERETPLLAMAARIAAAHHERWDGSGYPRGLRGEKIPLEARIVALADVYDALSSPRPYKPAFSEEKCDAILLEMRGSHLDPAIVDLFFERRQEFAALRLRLADAIPVELERSA